MKRIILITICAFLSNISWSQSQEEIQLAQEYYIKGDFYKAVYYYKKIYKSNNSVIYYTRYLDCLIKTEEYKTAEKLIIKRVKSNKGDLNLQLSLAQFYIDRESNDKANKIFEDVYTNTINTPQNIDKTYNAFIEVDQVDWAIKTLEKGRKKNRKSTQINFNFAKAYSIQGEKDKMLNELLDVLSFDSYSIQTVKDLLINRIEFLNKEDDLLKLLIKKLININQKQSDKIVYLKLLIWTFVQSENYNAALTQAIGLDKRFNLMGEEVMRIGQICLDNKQFTIANKAFKYIVNLNQETEFFYLAEQLILNANFLKITSSRDYTKQEIDDCINEYEKILSKYNKGRKTLKLIIELAYIKSYYADMPKQGIELLNNALKIKSLTDIQRAKIKVKLADIHVLKGDIWEASLLYMQVENDFKFELIGEEAKFKNAQVFYYNGEFDYAQSQLDILKESTSKLIANDALELSVLITENFGLDSNYQAMNWFANGELLMKQHKYKNAFNLFDSISLVYPGNGLADEILLRKGNAMFEQGYFQNALDLYLKIIDNYPQEILGDNAMYKIAELYQFYIIDKTKAIETYKKLLVDYPGSLFSDEARKRYRILRGDKIVDDSNPEYRKWNN